MSLNSRSAGILLSLLCFLFFLGSASATDLTSLSVQSSTYVPGQEGRYTLTFKSGEQLNLSVGSYVYVNFPQGFSFVQNSISSEDPGCTLASIQYKNNSTDKYWSVLNGDVSVAGDVYRFIFQPTVSGSVYTNANINIYMVVPGVVNAPAVGTGTVTLSVYGANGNSYTKSASVTLGDPPASAPSNLGVVAANSLKVNATWDTVVGATRYQLLYSSDPEGTYIQACDFGKEPDPGQEWSLTSNSCSYSGTGNGGLEAGKTYYFKVRAGNQYGYGPASQPVAVAIPAVTLQQSTPVDGGYASIGGSITAVFNQPVRITDNDKIQVYEKNTGKPVTKNQVSVDGSTVTISAALSYRTAYQVVFHELALEGTVCQGFYNRLIGWSFTTYGSSSGSSNPVSSSTSPATNSGLTSSFSDADVASALKNAETSPKVTLSTSGSTTGLSLTISQLGTIASMGKPVEVTVSNADVNLTLDPAALLGGIQGTAQSVSIGARVVDSGATPAGGAVMIAGKVFELSITALMQDGKTQSIDKLAGTISVALPVTAESKEAAQRGELTAAYYDQESGSWVSLDNGTYDAEKGAFSFQTSHLSKWALVYKESLGGPVTFSDIQGHWAQKEVEFMAGKGYLKGVGGGLFAPENNVTRAEFAAMLARCLGLLGEQQCPFADVPQDAWFRNAVSQAYTAGIVKGISDSSFAPDSLISREQTAMMAANALRYKNAKESAGIDVLDQFADKNLISDWAAESCAMAVDKGIIKGSGGLFAPANNATRAEAAVMLYRVLNSLNLERGE
ncbi:S-layer homology domain-containing protein [Pelotomaculum isophthalicicum JI]|uniref:S-layer homology domain-containing protein n=1 Tax=Pelotomaculum isophthalicicum JI TaxID=947010 RepID=A0A9X4H5Z3_9FIRM|nr:S-layer homology domain-containing protein [Pelotomaculum isophthalicicum]MDF9408792.1 S-layer homology domain-containing protein [Pelotomaculum isophthalicicum JI]